ncbi:uncharacterized protein EAF01_008054 [Botrytis porri]|uniref:uncharacterized protein n=1 Tax=Botrytis porri TaxID=87229 RepID=UPI0018FFEDD9|nr:uncharacterized protein EAF01_008054 [Botrytis porri]KAF7898841.1 hypothetical protein EAF01_008054 [Botrytis porri]
MPPKQVSCPEPHGSQSLRIIRTARFELDLLLTTLEIATETPNFEKYVVDVFRKVVRQGEENIGGLAPDREFVVHERVVKVGRYRPFDLHGVLRDGEIRGGVRDDRLVVGELGHDGCCGYQCSETMSFDTPEGSIESYPVSYTRLEVSVSRSALSEVNEG